jgi:hypothetical protein
LKKEESEEITSTARKQSDKISVSSVIRDRNKLNYYTSENFKKNSLKLSDKYSFTSTKSKKSNGKKTTNKDLPSLKSEPKQHPISYKPPSQSENSEDTYLRQEFTRKKRVALHTQKLL